MVSRMGRAQEKRGTLVSHLLLGLSVVTYRVGAGLHTVTPAWGPGVLRSLFCNQRKRAMARATIQKKEKGSTSLGKMCAWLLFYLTLHPECHWGFVEHLPWKQTEQNY